MNYLGEIRAFNDSLMFKSLSTGQIALWYALMSVNNKCAWIEWFTVANQTLELMTGMSRGGVDKARNSLKQLGYIDFKSNGRKAASYKIFSLTSNSMQERSDKEAIKKPNGSDKEAERKPNSSALNKLNETKQNNKKEKDKKEKDKKEKPSSVPKEKIQYAEFVSMTEEEYNSLSSRFGVAKTKRMIEVLDNYKGSNGKLYKSDYRAILNWVAGRVEEEFSKNGNEGECWF